MENITVSKLSSMIEKKLSHNFGVAPEQASDELFYKASVLALLEIMNERRAEFKKSAQKQNAKTVYYLSMEFLMGRSFKSNLYNLDLTDTMAKALKKFGVKLDNLFELEPDAGLGNGGLGRLAACFWMRLQAAVIRQWDIPFVTNWVYSAKTLWTVGKPKCLTFGSPAEVFGLNRNTVRQLTSTLTVM